MREKGALLCGVTNSFSRPSEKSREASKVPVPSSPPHQPAPFLSSSSPPLSLPSSAHCGALASCDRAGARMGGRGGLVSTSGGWEHCWVSLCACLSETEIKCAVPRRAAGVYPCAFVCNCAFAHVDAHAQLASRKHRCASVCLRDFLLLSYVRRTYKCRGTRTSPTRFSRHTRTGHTVSFCGVSYVTEGRVWWQR